ncbi:MAG: hypothetical protein P1P64_07900 [Treponemataceae bacterium]
MLDISGVEEENMISRASVEKVIREKTKLNHKNGYIETIEENLLPKISKELFEENFRRGRGNELESKFRSVASSSALAVNNFALIKKWKDQFIFETHTNFIYAQFEKEFSTDLKGTNPQLDFYLENEEVIIGFESKFLEYFDKTTADFSQSYYTLKYLDKFWFDLMDEYQGQEFYLDVAQLLKHSFGLINQSKKANKKGYLVFVYWLPENYEDIDTCNTFLQELELFANKMKDQNMIIFKPMSYFDFWEKYQNIELFKENIKLLKDRYGGINI